MDSLVNVFKYRKRDFQKVAPFATKNKKPCINLYLAGLHIFDEKLGLTNETRYEKSKA
jgi:hypothetical protein